MIKNDFETQLQQKICNSPFTSMNFNTSLNIGQPNIYGNDRFLYASNENKTPTLNNSMNSISPINNMNDFNNISKNKIDGNSNQNFICYPFYNIFSCCLNDPSNKIINFRNQNSKKKAFTPEEDKLLLDLIKINGVGNWKKISLNMQKNNFHRNGRQCRDRYYHYLDPSIISCCDWTPEEDHLILKIVEEEGKKWKGMEKIFPGRTEVSLRNRYNLLIRKKSKEQRKESKIKQSSENLKVSSQSFNSECEKINDPILDTFFDEEFNIEKIFDDSLF